MTTYQFLSAINDIPEEYIEETLPLSHRTKHIPRFAIALIALIALMLMAAGAVYFRFDSYIARWFLTDAPVPPSTHILTIDNPIMYDEGNELQLMDVLISGDSAKISVLVTLKESAQPLNIMAPKSGCEFGEIIINGSRELSSATFYQSDDIGLTENQFLSVFTVSGISDDFEIYLKDVGYVPSETGAFTAIYEGELVAQVTLDDAIAPIVYPIYENVSLDEEIIYVEEVTLTAFGCRISILTTEEIMQRLDFNNSTLVIPDGVVHCAFSGTWTVSENELQSITLTSEFPTPIIPEAVSAVTFGDIQIKFHNEKDD